LVSIKLLLLLCFRLWSKVSAQPISHPPQSHLPPSLHLSIRGEGPLDLFFGNPCMSAGTRAIILVSPCLLVVYKWQSPSPIPRDWLSKVHPVEIGVGFISKLLLHSDLRESSWWLGYVDLELWMLLSRNFRPHPPGFFETMSLLVPLFTVFVCEEGVLITIVVNSKWGENGWVRKSSASKIPQLPQFSTEAAFPSTTQDLGVDWKNSLKLCCEG